MSRRSPSSRPPAGARRVALGRVGEALVGVVSWGTCDEADVPAPELMSVYLAADHQGTEVASALLTHAIGHAPAHLWVFENNPRAHAFSVDTEGTFDLDSDLELWFSRLRSVKLELSRGVDIREPNRLIGDHAL